MLEAISYTMSKIIDKSYKVLLCISSVVLFMIYIIYDGEFNMMPDAVNRQSCFIYSIIISILFIILFRRDNLFCPEVLILIVFVFSSFFNEIILENLESLHGVSSVFRTAFNDNIENKSLIVQTLSLTLFIFGASSIRLTSSNKARIIPKKFHIKYNLRISVIIVVTLIGVYLLFLFGIGDIASWFHYSNSSNYSNTSIVYLTILFLVCTALEFSNLTKSNVCYFFSFLKHINKIYLLEILTVSFLLMVSGNRNESLLIILPAVAAYSIFIQRFSNKFFFICAFIGSIIMILVGVTRQQEVSISGAQNSEISLFEIGRDYGSVDLSSKYLIEYTDNKSPIYFNNAILNIFSSIPLLGGVYVAITDSEQDMRSTELTTLGMQNADNMDSGLGTSLVGDLYYSGGAIFTFFFMFGFGYFFSYLYKRFFIKKEYNIWLLLVYLFLFSNSLYCIRAEWTMPFRYLGFSFVLILALLPFSKKQIYYE